jgi:hypothetical protein
MDITKQKQRCCDGDREDRALCESGSRNRYFPRKTMTADDFNREQAYMIGRRRLLNRAVTGWGVVYGLAVTLDKQELTVAPGLALDRHGREVIVAAPHVLRHCDLFVRQKGRCEPSDEKPAPGRWLLSAHYAERRIDAVRLADPCNDCGRPEWNRVCETVLFSLSPLAPETCPSAEPGCPDPCKCPPQPSKSGVTSEGPHSVPPVSEPHASPDQTQPDAKTATQPSVTPVPIPPYPRGPHSTLCCWSRHVRIDSDGELCPWNQHCVDSCDPVPIACVTLTGFDKCGGPIFDQVEECAPRRIVKRNDMLFDLLRGCDLTRIVNVSWVGWTKLSYVEWKTFRPFFKDNEQDLRGRECPTTFSIDFSGPVRAETVTPYAISITGIFQDTLTGWNRPIRLPVERFDCDPPDQAKNDPAGTTRRASIVVDGDWIWHEIQGNKSAFQVPNNVDYYPFLEIEIYGDLILDCRGQPVDANSFGPDIVPTGNGTPGGTCRTVFRVGPRPLPSSAQIGQSS